MFVEGADEVDAGKTHLAGKPLFVYFVHNVYFVHTCDVDSESTAEFRMNRIVRRGDE